MVNSRLNLFTAAPSGSTSKWLHPSGAPLIPKLRGNFAEFLNDGYLDHLSILYLPTCVGFGTGTRVLPRGFSRRHGVGDSPAKGQLASHLGLAVPRLTRTTPTCLPQDYHRLGSLSLPRPPIGQANTTWYRNINLLAIDYAFRPRLRIRLTLRRKSLRRKPWAYGVQVFHLHYRYSCQHSHF